ncbi:MAG: hypothetical protein ACK4Q5_11670 [Saprospiraceae bacterium]
MKKTVVTGLCLLFASLVFAQKFREHPEHNPKQEARNKGSVILFHVTYAAHWTGADLADRFGFSNAIGPGLDFTTANNFIFGADFQYTYGTKVKEDPLDPIRVDSGYIVGFGRNIASVALRQRGFYLGGHVGKLFTFGNSNRSGLRLTLGAGVLRHSIRVQDNSQSVPQLVDNYQKGYDRLTGGLALNQLIGYQLIGRTRSINYFIGFEFNQGFTRSLRDWDFAEMKKLEGSRFDFRYGIRVGWALPFYFTKPETVYY